MANHKPLNLPSDRSSRIARALEAEEGWIAAGISESRIRDYQEPANDGDIAAKKDQSPISLAIGLLVIAELIVLARRVSQEKLQKSVAMAGVTIEELEATEHARRAPTRNLLRALASALDISFLKLLQLVGQTKEKENDAHLDRKVLKVMTDAQLDGSSRMEVTVLQDIQQLLHE
jgi:transcriptional regulator with XRE-family HTH domain